MRRVMMETESAEIEFSSSPVRMGIGLLGVEIEVSGGVSSGYLESLRLEEIERRILAIEAKLEENDDEILQSGIG